MRERNKLRVRAVEAVAERKKAVVRELAAIKTLERILEASLALFSPEIRLTIVIRRNPHQNAPPSRAGNA